MQKKTKKVKRITKQVQMKVKTGVKSGWGDPRYVELTLERYPQDPELLSNPPIIYLQDQYKIEGKT